MLQKLKMCNIEHFLRLLSKKKPKIDLLLFFEVLFLFPYYQAETDNISFLLISFQIVFATTYYTYSENFSQGLTLEDLHSVFKIDFRKKITV